MRIYSNTLFFLFILAYKLFLPFNAFGGSIYENGLKNYIKDDLKKFLFIKEKNKVKSLKTIDRQNNIVEINTERKILIINFWATWCAPCKKEMPSLNHLAKKFKKEKLEIVTIASGRNSISHIEDFFLKNQIDELPKYRDPSGKTAISYKVIGLPTTIIVNSRGEEVGRILGDIDWQKEEIYDFFNALLKIENI
ncbi:hypothetical protein CBE37_03520 [bacterium TMED277]|nr:MAG: hypothetical protein CBE37_03520 [bacterium TMED277]